MKKDRYKTMFGFTLLELLVVISIIAILIAMGAVAFSTAQRRGRDGRRRADMKAAQSAFEQYYSANSAAYDSSSNCSNMAGALQGGMPSDPQPDQSYTCGVLSGIGNTTTNSYCACALLEKPDGNSSDSDCTFVSSGDGDYFCVSNLQ